MSIEDCSITCFQDEDNESDEEEQDNTGNSVINRQGAVGELPPSDSESEEEEAAGDKVCHLVLSVL